MKRREVTRKAVPAALREALQFVKAKPEESLCDAVSIKAVKDNSDLIYICSAGPFYDRNRGIPLFCLCFMFMIGSTKSRILASFSRAGMT